jgi:hypothetical protein
VAYELARSLHDPVKQKRAKMISTVAICVNVLKRLAG